MKQQHGFTLIEVFVVLAIIGILVALVLPAAMFGKPSRTNVTWGVNGVTETRCIAGFKHVVGGGGQARQVIGPNGGGVPCDD